jgi:hypothetical protein
MRSNTQGTQGLAKVTWEELVTAFFLLHTHTLTEMQHWWYTDLLMQHFMHLVNYTCNFKATRFIKICDAGLCQFTAKVNPRVLHATATLSDLESSVSCESLPPKLTSLAHFGIGDALKIWIPQSENVPGHSLPPITELSILHLVDL